MPQPTLLLLVGLAGAAGALCRYGVYQLVQRFHADPPPTVAPLSTLIVNLLGCFLFAFIWSYAAVGHRVGPEARLVVLTGFLGAFTTFSTFGFETMHLLQRGDYLRALAYAAAQNLGGLALAFAGYHLGRAIA